MLIRHARLITFLVASAAMLIGLCGPAGAHVPPPDGTSYNCAVYQNIYGAANNTVALEQHVHGCNSGALARVDINLGFSRGSTQLKSIVRTCYSANSTLANCVKDFVFKYADPAGNQQWAVSCVVTYYNTIGARAAVYKNTTYATY